MKIVKHGVVIITEQEIKIEGWHVERELTDPPVSEASAEQLLLEVTIPWAQKKMNTAIAENLQRISKDIKAGIVTRNPTKNPTEN